MINQVWFSLILGLSDYEDEKEELIFYKFFFEYL